MKMSTRGNSNPTRGNKTNKRGRRKMSRSESPNSVEEVEANYDSGEGSGVSGSQVSINDLPPEMLTEILKYVDFLGILRCRLVSRQFSEIASRILHDRPESTLQFEGVREQPKLTRQDVVLFDRNFENKRLLTWGIHFWKGGIRRPFHEFIQCMKNAKTNPFVNFGFKITIDCSYEAVLGELTPEVLDSFFNKERWSEFLLALSTLTVQRLKLSFSKVRPFENVFHVLVDKLQDFLLTKMPHLQEFELNFVDTNAAPEAKLFPHPIPIPIQIQTDGEENSPASSSSSSVAVQKIQLQLQLPRLKVISINSSMISNYTEIMRDLLNAAVNLTRIQGVFEHHEDFLFLHSIGKLHLLKDATFMIHEGFFSSKNEKVFTPVAYPFPKLKELTLMTTEKPPTSDDKSYLTWAGFFVNNLFEFSKDSLIGLRIHLKEFLPGLALPKFKTLQNIHLATVYTRQGHSRPLFPFGISSRDIFPAVCYLGETVEDWLAVFPFQESIPRFPNVKVLNLSCYSRQRVSIEPKVISIIGSMCPNLKHLRLLDNRRPFKPNYSIPAMNFLEVGRMIWTHMTQLETLQIDLDMDSDENNPLALDSCFTGFSLDECQRLYGPLKPCPKSQKWKILKSKLQSESDQESESQLPFERTYPSILDLKDLKKIEILPFSKGRLVKVEDFLANNWTWISKEYAFNLMPNLEQLTNNGHSEHAESGFT